MPAPYPREFREAARLISAAIHVLADGSAFRNRLIHLELILARGTMGRGLKSIRTARARAYSPLRRYGQSDGRIHAGSGTAMRYTRFQFRNFRGIRDTRLDLNFKGIPHRVVTLVGLNESGKTTVLEAIDLFYPTGAGEVSGVSPKELSAWTPKDPFDLIPIAERTNFGGKITVSATIALSEDDLRAINAAVAETSGGYKVLSLDDGIEITQEWSFSDSRHIETRTLWPRKLGMGRPSGARKDRPISTEENREIWGTVIGEIRKRLPLIWYFPSDLFDLPEEVTLTSQANESATNRFFRYLFQDILDSLGRGLNVQTHVIDRARSADSGDERALRQLLLEASREVTTSVVQAWNDIFDKSDIGSRQVKIDLVPTAGPPSAPDRPVAIRFALEDSDGTFSIHERSLGFRWFFVYLLVTKYRGQQRTNGSDMLFLFDEPASNLHPTAQGALLRSLERLSGDAVIIFTTHSHHLVNPAWLSSAYVVTNGDTDPTLVSSNAAGMHTDISVRRYHDFAAQSPSRSHFFQPILDVLDYRPSLLESVPRLVMVEGKGDYYLLKYFSSQFSNEERHRAINWLPGAGATSLRPLIRLYLGWARNFVVLLDGDKEGKRALATYRAEFGVDLEGRLMTLDTAVDARGVGAIESLMPETDRMAFQRLVAPDEGNYRKEVFARGVQEALATKALVPLSEQSTSYLTAICDNLIAALDEQESTT